MNESNVSLANSSSINTYYCKYDGPDTDLEKNTKRSFFVLLIILGISFNIFVIILAAKFTIRKNLHYLIINMAVSDALFLFMLLWLYLPWISGSKWRIYPEGILGVIFCKTAMFFLYSSYMVSLITLLVISIERFKATRQRLQRSRQYTLKQRLLIIGFSWLFSTPTAVSYAIGAKVTREGKSCNAVSLAHGAQIIILSNFIVVVILCCVIFFLSILTIRRLTKPQAIENHLREQQRSERARRTRAAVRMVLASVLLYICCWIPSTFFLVLSWVNLVIPSANIFSECIDIRSVKFIVLVFLPTINSCCSPSLYIIFLTDFRQAAKKVCCRISSIPNRRNNFELHPIPRGRQNFQDIQL